jgi:uncharacterized protein with HEPN domain
VKIRTSTKDIIGFRNVLSHGFDIVSNKTVYEIKKYNLPMFHNTIIELGQSGSETIKNQLRIYNTKS